MLIIDSRNRVAAHSDPFVAKVVGEVSSESLRAFVNMLAFPRHFFAENSANRRARDLLVKRVTSFGYKPSFRATSTTL
jgi:hypothetical protein